MEPQNQLAALMAFWRQNMRPGGGGMDYGRWNSAPPDDGATWAQGMMERYATPGSAGGAERPDFFADDAAPRNAIAAFVRPRSFDERMPTYSAPAEDPVRARVRNHLLSMLGGSR